MESHPLIYNNDETDKFSEKNHTFRDTSPALPGLGKYYLQKRIANQMTRKEDQKPVFNALKLKSLFFRVCLPLWMTSLLFTSGFAQVPAKLTWKEVLRQ